MSAGLRVYAQRCSDSPKLPLRPHDLVEPRGEDLAGLIGHVRLREDGVVVGTVLLLSLQCL